MNLNFQLSLNKAKQNINMMRRNKSITKLPSQLGGAYAVGKENNFEGYYIIISV